MSLTHERPPAKLYDIISRACANCDGSGLLPGNGRDGLPRRCKACQGEGFYTARVRRDAGTGFAARQTGPEARRAA